MTGVVVMGICFAVAFVLYGVVIVFLLLRVRDLGRRVEGGSSNPVYGGRR